MTAANEFEEIVTAGFPELLLLGDEQLRAHSLLSLVSKAESVNQIGGLITLELRPLTEAQGREVLALTLAGYGIWIAKQCAPEQLPRQLENFATAARLARAFLDVKVEVI